METDKNISEYLYKSWNSPTNVILTGLIAGLFFWLYEPFRFTDWGIENNILWIYVLVLILIGMAIISISRTIMFKYGKNNNLSYIIFTAWISTEIILMAAVYSLVPVFIKGGFSFEKFSNDFAIALKYTPLAVLIPYSISLLIIIALDERLQIIRLKEKLVNNENLNSPTNSNITFLDERKEMRLSIKKENLLYIESADNYVCIWFLRNGIINKFFLRNTLKNMENLFIGSNVLRCHRSYIVNFDHVNTITRNHDGVFIEMDNQSIANIPVSKSYTEGVTKYFIGQN